jgi:hypothetical protein
MSYAKGDYRWWGLDENDLGAVLYNILAPIQFGDDDYGNDWSEFEKRNPGGAYAWRVASQHKVLDQAVIALRPVQKFVRVRRLPISTPKGNITREEWLRATIDLFLFRTMGIRDHCLHLVSEVFELGLAPLEVKLRKVTGAADIQGTRIAELIEKIASVGQEHRAERNQRAHEGVQRSLTDEPFFTVLSMMEPTGPKRQKTSKPKPSEIKHGVLPFQDVRTSDEYHLPTVYVALAERLENEFLPVGDEIVAAVRELTDELCGTFCARFDAKNGST